MLNNEGITRWFHKMRKNLFIKNSIYFGRLCHHQELHETDSNLNGFKRINIFEVVGVDVSYVQ
jgi:hypothetical protein